MKWKLLNIPQASNAISMCPVMIVWCYILRPNNMSVNRFDYNNNYESDIKARGGNPWNWVLCRWTWNKGEFFHFFKAQALNTMIFTFTFPVLQQLGTLHLPLLHPNCPDSDHFLAFLSTPIHIISCKVNLDLFNRFIKKKSVLWIRKTFFWFNIVFITFKLFYIYV